MPHIVWFGVLTTVDMCFSSRSYWHKYGIPNFVDSFTN